jgi:ABC-type uncharacterized transport system substrate-binding protein
MRTRREFITLLGGAAVAWPLAARAQQATKHYRIGMLFPTSPTANAANLNAFRQRLQELGYVEGRNLVIDYRSAEGRPDRFPVLAAELVNLKADLIMTRGTPAALAAKSATRTIPVVMAAIGEAVETGVVASIAHPGGNITGAEQLYCGCSVQAVGTFIRNGSERPTDRPPFRIE